MPVDVVEQPITLNELAREAVMETATLGEAATLLLTKVQGNRDLIRQMIHQAAADLVRQVRVHSRGAMENEYLDARERGIRRHVASLAARMSIYDWQLPVTGKPIGDATVDDLGDAVNYHSAKAEFETGRARMYGVVLQRLRRSNAATVREAMSERTLAKLMNTEESAA